MVLASLHRASFELIKHCWPPVREVAQAVGSLASSVEGVKYCGKNHQQVHLLSQHIDSLFPGRYGTRILD